MEIYNIKQIWNSIDPKLELSYDKVYRFFTGNYSVLSMNELEAVEKVLKAKNKEAMDIVKTAKSKLK